MSRIKEMRKKMNMTQEDLAKAIGSSRPHISDIESGKTHPTTKTIERMASALECEPRDLM